MFLSVVVPEELELLLEELEEELEELLELELELLEELLLELEESLLEPPVPPPPPPPQAVSIARTITPARRAAAKRLNIFIVMFLLFSNSDGLGDPKSLYPSEFILSIPPPHVNRHIAQIPQFFLAIVPKRKKAPEQDELLPSYPAGLPPPSVREATLSVIAARCQLPREGELICCKPSDA